MRPTCDPNNSKLYSDVQCDAVDSICTCTNPVTGEANQPLRQASIKAKDMLVCSGTKVKYFQHLQGYSMTAFSVLHQLIICIN